MKKRVVAFLVVISSLLVGSIFTAPSVAAVDNFTITNFEAEMELGRDDERRSTLHVTETITADFQRRNENRGLERVFVKEYDGHSTSFKLESVIDENGNELPYHWNGDALRIGEENVYVFGPKTYRITYSQRDVTKYYADTGYDEFYWDAIGTDWRVPIERATVRLTVAPEIQAAVTSNANCYTGLAGSTALCDINKEEGVYVAESENLGRSQGVTVALGLKAGTFSGYEMSLAEKLFRLWAMVTLITTIIGILVIIWIMVKAHRWKYRTAEIGTIVPEYLPPKNASLAASAAVSPEYRATAAAELTDFAVRHYIQILQTRIKKVFLPAQFDIKVVRDISTLREEEREILSDMFGYEPKVDDRLSLKDLQNNSAAHGRFLDNDKKLRELMRHQYKLKQIDTGKRTWFGRAATAILILAILTLSPMLFIASIVAFVFSKMLWVLSDEGLALRRYLKGLEMYIKVAEKDRLKMLQSPEGAQKVELKDPNDPAQLVKLYERVLPYAILFGQEKEWTKQIGEYYASMNSSPDWYSGRAAFNAAAFSTAMTSFSSSASASSAASSSGGTGGGGFSGGGGGGGGGGGW